MGLEKVIAPRDRTEAYLHETVQSIVDAMADTQKTLQAVFPQLCVLPQVSRNVSFVTSQELEDTYPALTPKQREDAWVKDHPTTFLQGIGAPLKSGQRHDGRARTTTTGASTGDILLWDSVLGPGH